MPWPLGGGPMSAPRRVMLVTASHSPIIEFPEVETDAYHRVVAALDEVRAEVTAFDPELVVVFGVDHYGGHHMRCMPAFCVGVEATALADVGGTPGQLVVPREIAVGAVDHLRRAGVDTAVSYAMDVDHGFTQALVRLTGGIDRYPVLPIFAVRWASLRCSSTRPLRRAPSLAAASRKRHSE